MFEAKSEDIRRFFDLLGSIFCGLFYSFALWENSFRRTTNYKYFYLPIFLSAGLCIYLFFYRLIWRKLKTHFLHGYSNFLVISIFAGTLFFSIASPLGHFLLSQTVSIFVTRFSLFVSGLSVIKLFLGFCLISLPMAFFWFLGILITWKFSKKQFMP